MIITAFSSHGTFTFDAITGGVINTDLSDSFGSFPYRVNVYEYFDYYQESLPLVVDVLDIGFHDLVGIYVEPVHEWRTER